MFIGHEYKSRVVIDSFFFVLYQRLAGIINMKLVIVLLLSTCCVITKGCSDTTIQRSRTNSLVEICSGGQWLSACASDDIWTDDLAVIACEELGSPSVEARAIAAGGETSSTDTVIVIGECNRTETLGECGITKRTGGCLAPDIYIGVICSPLCEEALCNSSSCYPPLSTCHCPTLLRNATYPQDTQCQNGGTCNSGQCMCPPGWSGVRCEEDITAMCTPPCSNGGTCTGTNTCQCPDNWEGLLCDNAKDSNNNDGLIAALVTVTVLLLVMVAVGIVLGVVIHWRKKRKSHSLTDKDPVTHTSISVHSTDTSVNQTPSTDLFINESYGVTEGPQNLPSQQEEEQPKEEKPISSTEEKEHTPVYSNTETQEQPVYSNTENQEEQPMANEDNHHLGHNQNFPEEQQNPVDEGNHIWMEENEEVGETPTETPKTVKQTTDQGITEKKEVTTSTSDSAQNDSDVYHEYSYIDGDTDNVLLTTTGTDIYHEYSSVEFEDACQATPLYHNITRSTEISTDQATTEVVYDYASTGECMKRGAPQTSQLADTTAHGCVNTHRK